MTDTAREAVARARAFAAYVAWCYFAPHRWKLSPIGLAILPYAGEWAYRDAAPKLESETGQREP